MVLIPVPKKTRGQAGLIGLLVVVLIMGILAAIYYPRIAARHSAPGAPPTPVERAAGSNCGLYATQLNQALMMYRDSNDGKNPATLNDLRPYGVTNDIINSPGCYFRIDPQTGNIRDFGKGKAAPASVDARGNYVPGMSGTPGSTPQITIPTVGGM